MIASVSSSANCDTSHDRVTARCSEDQCHALDELGVVEGPEAGGGIPALGGLEAGAGAGGAGAGLLGACVGAGHHICRYMVKEQGKETHIGWNAMARQGAFDR